MSLSVFTSSISKARASLYTMTAPLTCLFSLSGPEAYINCLSPDEQITYTHAHLFPHYQYGRLLSRESHILQLYPPRIVTNSSLFAQLPIPLTCRRVFCCSPSFPIINAEWRPKHPKHGSSHTNYVLFSIVMTNFMRYSRTYKEKYIGGT